MENIISTEICKKCAKCCKNYPFIELSKNEINSLEHISGLDFNVFTNSIDKAVGKYFLQFQKNGDCFFLNEDNGIYSCEVYEARPGICKNYPSETKQKKVCNSD
jgi:Fe-S-cluster containining protein